MRRFELQLALRICMLTAGREPRRDTSPRSPLSDLRPIRSPIPPITRPDTAGRARLTRLIPPDVLVGYHLCYGTFPEWPMYEARDMGLLVRMANFAVANSGRTVDWLHLAGPRYLRSEDRSFFRPLVDLEPGDARVFLGIVLPIDGAAGLRRRHATASRYIRLRCGDVLRVRPPAWRGRHRDHARARARGPHRP